MSQYPGQGYYGSQDHHGGGGGGYNQGGYNQGGYNQGGYNQGGYNQGGYNQGGYGQQQDQYHRPPPGPPPPETRPPGYGYDDGRQGSYGGHGGGHQGSSYNRYPPPSRPPPPGLDSYGYPIHQQGYGHSSRGYHQPPPTDRPQQFGHGAPEGYMFQYSKCTGRRKALLIGINYFGQKGELRGCINDVHNLSRFLIERHGYKREDMVQLTDDQSNPVMQPTRDNILRAMGWLVKDAQPNDSLFLHYSGHGGQTEDLDGDEDDGYDEVIYPVDHERVGHIVDDEIHFRVVRPLQAGVRLTAIFDSCHSGSVMDLPYIYSTKGVLKEPNLAKEAASGLLGAFTAYASGDLAGAAKSVFGFAKTAYKGDDAYEKTKDTRTSPADVIMWSGSKDEQTSADATINSQATGAMSYAFTRALKEHGEQSYVELLNNIRDILENEYSQKPQLSSSHPMDTELLFIM
jgi:hypothetical protein